MELHLLLLPLPASEVAAGFLKVIHEVLPNSHIQSFNLMYRVEKGSASEVLAPSNKLASEISASPEFAKKLEVLAKRPYLDVSSLNIVAAGGLELHYYEQPSKVYIAILADDFLALSAADAVSAHFTIHKQAEMAGEFITESQQQVLQASANAAAEMRAVAARLATLSAENVNRLNEETLRKFAELLKAGDQGLEAGTCQC